MTKIFFIFKIFLTPKIFLVHKNFFDTKNFSHFKNIFNSKKISFTKNYLKNIKCAFQKLFAQKSSAIKNFFSFDRSNNIWRYNNVAIRKLILNMMKNIS